MVRASNLEKSVKTGQPNGQVISGQDFITSPENFCSTTFRRHRNINNNGIEIYLCGSVIVFALSWHNGWYVPWSSWVNFEMTREDYGLFIWNGRCFTYVPPAFRLRRLFMIQILRVYINWSNAYLSSMHTVIIVHAAASFVSLFRCIMVMFIGVMFHDISTER